MLRLLEEEEKEEVEENDYDNNCFFSMFSQNFDQFLSAFTLITCNKVNNVYKILQNIYIQTEETYLTLK